MANHRKYISLTKVYMFCLTMAIGYSLDVFLCTHKDIGLCSVLGRLVGLVNWNYYQLSPSTFEVKGQHLLAVKGQQVFVCTSYETTMHFCKDRHANKP